VLRRCPRRWWAFSSNKTRRLRKESGAANKYEGGGKRALPPFFPRVPCGGARSLARLPGTIGNSPRAFSPFRSPRSAYYSSTARPSSRVLLSPSGWVHGHRALLPFGFAFLSKSFASRNWRKLASFKTSCLPPHPLRAAGVTISHEFQPVMEVGRADYLDLLQAQRRDDRPVCRRRSSGKGLPAALYAALPPSATPSRHP